MNWFTAEVEVSISEMRFVSNALVTVALKDLNLDPAAFRADHQIRHMVADMAARSVIEKLLAPQSN